LLIVNVENKKLKFWARCWSIVHSELFGKIAK
jgi:hypothetical protein